MNPHVRTTLAAKALGQPWMLYRPVAESMKAVVLRHAVGADIDQEQLERLIAERDERRRTRGAVSRRTAFAVDGGTRGMSVDPDEREMFYRAGPGGCVAVVPVEGLICKYASMVNGISQPQGMTPGDLTYALNAALACIGSGVRSIVLDIDSPGGTVAGSHDICEAIEAAKAFRSADGSAVPIVAYAHDLCCSAAYLLASQCDAVYCSEQATVAQA